MSDNEAPNHPFYEETIASKPVYRGRVISLQVDTVRLPNGKTSEREIVRHPGAVAVLALRGDRMLAVEQYRKALEKVQLEIPAGKLDPAEEPREAALRELEEETGCRARSLQHVWSFSTSPGFADEVLHLFFTDDLEPGEVRLDEDEFLTCSELTLEEAENAIREGRICDAKTLLAVQFWKNRRLAGQAIR
jgi:ADP-ribose pyrophosphatase